jgi:DNA-binding NtrC family response regulator
VQERILIVDDESSIRFGLRRFLEAAGFEVDEAASYGAAAEACRRNKPDAAILDYTLPDGNGVELIDTVLLSAPDVPVIMLTGHGSIDLAVTAVKRGATTLLTKPVQLPALLTLLRESLDGKHRPRKETRARRTAPCEDPFLGTSEVIRTLKEQVRRLEGTRRPVLILGETGVGKGVLARWMHRGTRAFVDLNCAGLSDALIDSEMFGHAKGAFTGAVADKPGLLEMADGGTLFLDEIGDMPTAVQGKLLKVLEEKQFRRLGEARNRAADVRLVAATHCPLQRFVKENRFRADLYYRIAAHTITLPSLRQRVEDIPQIARTLLDHSTAESGREHVTLSKSAVAALSSYAWPGNIRELRNVLERGLVALDRNEREIDRAHLGLGSGRNEELDLPPQSQTLRDVERDQIEQVLQAAGGRVEDAARILGVPRSSLYVKIRKYGITVSKMG